MTSLVKPGEPLILADGTRIDETGHAIRNLVEIPTQTEAQRYVTSVRRKLADLPEVPNKMNMISVILTYQLFGLSDEDIAVATGLTTEQVERIQLHDAFNSMLDEVISSIRKHDLDEVRGLLKDNEVRAARRISSLIDSDSESIQIAAAKDVLDRGGHRPADVVEHRLRVDGGLTIEVIKRDATNDIPSFVIDQE